MKRYKLLFALVALIPSLSTWAGPARPGQRTLPTADGSVVTVSLVGDETHHFYLSDEGIAYLLKEGVLHETELNRLQPSATRSEGQLTRAGGRLTRAGAGLTPDASYPAFGEQHSLVILVEFSDVRMTLDNAHDYFHRMLNQEGFSDWGGTGSARDYFIECSAGQFSPTFDVYGPIALPNRMAYYGGNDSQGLDRRPAEMIADACRLLDSTIDFSKYDLDNDGYIDNVFVFYAGEGEAGGGSEDTVWPHTWFVTAGIDQQQVLDGVVLDRYACSSEWVVDNLGERPDGVGSFIHEFSHVLGLPDLYTTDYSRILTPGGWSVLDTGTYNNNGYTPPLYSAFERFALGWLQPKELNSSETITLNPINENEAAIFYTKNTDGKKVKNEYYLLENRQQTGWDAYLPGHGMLVWHIDYDGGVWWNNVVNNDASHQYVDLVEADGITTLRKNRKGDTFPGLKNVTSFGDDTKPSACSWDGIPSGISITDITEVNGLISFEVNKDASVPILWEDGSFGNESALSWHLEGESLILSQLAPGTKVKIFDLTGILICEGVADEDGYLVMSQPGQRLYIIVTPTYTHKIHLK